MRKVMAIVCGLLGLLAGLGFICPALSELRVQGALPTIGVLSLFLGIMLTIGGGSVIAFGVRKYHVRHRPR